MKLDVSRWTPVGSTVNTKYFVVAPDVLAAVPDVGTSDDEASARANVEFQNGHWKALGHPGVVLVFFDRMTGQDKKARKIYQEDLDATSTLGSALIGDSLLARAMTSFFLGFAKPRVPIKVFSDVDRALEWARQLNDAAKGRKA